MTTSDLNSTSFDSSDMEIVDDTDMDIASIPVDEFPLEAPVAVATPHKRTRTRLVKIHLPEGSTLYDFVRAYNIEKKIIDIAIAQNKLPNHLRDDAAQEIRITWSLLKPQTDRFSPSQVAAYANRIAGHAVLRLRREIGSAVRLPGSAFRVKGNGETYVSAGILAGSISIEDMDSYLNPGMVDTMSHYSDGSSLGGDIDADYPYAEEADASDESANAFIPLSAEDENSDVEGYYMEDLHDVAFKEFSAKLRVVAKDISPRQLKIAHLLLQDYTFEEIQRELGIRKNTIKKEMHQVGSYIIQMDLA